jgi:hypothetical protein
MNNAVADGTDNLKTNVLLQPLGQPDRATPMVWCFS